MVLTVTKDRGRKFWACVAARKKQGGSSPTLKMKKWCQNFNHALEFHLRTELKNSDLTEENVFAFFESQFLSDYVVYLRE